MGACVFRHRDYRRGFRFRGHRFSGRWNRKDSVLHFSCSVPGGPLGRARQARLGRAQERTPDFLVTAPKNPPVSPGNILETGERMQNTLSPPFLPLLAGCRKRELNQA